MTQNYFTYEVIHKKSASAREALQENYLHAETLMHDRRNVDKLE